MHEHDAVARQRFLEAMRGGASVTAAARTAGVARQTPYGWSEKDADVAAALEGAKGRGGRGRPRGPAADPGADDLRGLALGQLRLMLENKATEDRDKVAAARVILTATTPPKVTPAAPAASAEVDERTEARERAAADGRAFILKIKSGASA